MKKKILTVLLAGAAVATLGAGSASASALFNADGPIKFKFDGFDAAQTTYTGSCGSTTVALGVASCDAGGAFSSAAPGSMSGTVGTTEDTWGIANITTMLNDDGSSPTFGDPFWNQAPGTVGNPEGQNLLAYFYGFEDFNVDVTLGGVKTSSTGGHVDIYLLNDKTIYNTIRLAGPTAAARSAMVASLGSETKYLGLDFVPGCDFAAVTANDGYKEFATLCGSFTPTFASGNSTGTAMASSGVAELKFPYAFAFEQSVKACITGSLTNPCKGSSTGWTVRLATGSATTTMLPEPGALGLLGLGLVGLGLIGRRRKVA